MLGGTSWVGGQVAVEALARGHDVTCLARGESGDAPPGVSFVRTDRSATGAYDDVADQHWDAVVDVSRQPGQVRSALLALGATSSHWTLVSTGSVYADQSGPLTESSAVLEPVQGEVAEPDEYGEGKVACETAVAEHPHHLIVRAGLIGGPGDRSDRWGHYVARFALAGVEPVLVPDAADQPMQVIDVRDLARWIVGCAERGTTGVVHGSGESTTVGELIRLSARVAGFRGEQVTAAVDWLHRHGVEEWMGPRSLPLWLPPSHHGMGQMDDSLALELGLTRRSYAQTLADTLDDERQRGLGRERRASLGRADELELLSALRP